MNKFTLYRRARMEITRLIKVADRFIFSVYDHGYKGWCEYGPYNYQEAIKSRRLIFAQKVEQLLSKTHC